MVRKRRTELPNSDTLEFPEHIEQISMQQEAAPSQEMQPASSKPMRRPLRPGQGSYGTRCMVKANHFLVEISDKDLHQYDVSITPGVTSPGVNRAVMKQLVTLYKESHLGGRLPAYDGRKSLYTAGSLPFSSTEFTITLVDEEDVAREFKVVIKFAARANLHHLGMFLQGRQADAPQEAVRVLNIILRGLPMSHPGCVRVGRSLYSPDLGRKQPLGEGLESRHGFYQSIRPTKTYMSSTTFIEPLPVIDFVSQLLNKDLSVAKPLSHADRDKIKKARIGVKVEITHRRDTQRKYRITNLVSQVADEVIFSVDERGTIKSMVEYFEETYGYVIQYTQLPCLQVGNNQRPTCLPMEVCKIVEGQRYSKRLDERQITSLLELMCIQPRDREDDIRRTACLHLYAKISENSSRVEARVLPPPRRMVNGGKVKEWICINFSSGIEDAAVQIFCEELARTCTTFGMKFNPEPVLPVLSGRPDRVELVLKAMYHDAMIKLQPHKKELDLLIVILPNKCSLYGNVKRICETDLGIISQCCRRKNVRKRNKVYLESVSLKIKMKVGGRNTVLVDVLSRL